jgi:hypothetical protein
MTPPPSRKRSPYVRCRLCGRVFPGWLVVLDEPHASRLLYHLGATHPVECKPVLARMAMEDIGAVAMEVYERVQATQAGEP